MRLGKRILWCLGLAGENGPTLVTDQRSPPLCPDRGHGVPPSKRRHRHVLDSRGRERCSKAPRQHHVERAGLRVTMPSVVGTVRKTSLANPRCILFCCWRLRLRHRNRSSIACHGVSGSPWGGAKKRKRVPLTVALCSGWKSSPMIVAHLLAGNAGPARLAQADRVGLVLLDAGGRPGAVVYLSVSLGARPGACRSRNWGQSDTVCQQLRAFLPGERPSAGGEAYRREWKKGREHGKALLES